MHHRTHRKHSKESEPEASNNNEQPAVDLDPERHRGLRVPVLSVHHEDQHLPANELAIDRDRDPGICQGSLEANSGSDAPL